MPRYCIVVEYDGTPFVGWQRQAVGVSVQGALVDAIAKFSNEAVVVRGAGRTDAGVHATGQVAHFDLSKDWDAGRIREAMNFHLRPYPVAVIECQQAPLSLSHSHPPRAASA
jgi:tRNA pseudouridine38-40 synthase